MEDDIIDITTDDINITEELAISSRSGLEVYYNPARGELEIGVVCSWAFKLPEQVGTTIDIDQLLRVVGNLDEQYREARRNRRKL